jgi:heme/copper-type cytochrome/quinol oxidase subunit 3
MFPLCSKQVKVDLARGKRIFMMATISRLVGFVLSVAVTTLIARRVISNGGRRVRAVATGALASTVLSVVSDFTLAYAEQVYDRSLEAVMSRALVATFIGLAIAFFHFKISNERRELAGGAVMFMVGKIFFLVCVVAGALPQPALAEEEIRFAPKEFFNDIGDNVEVSGTLTGPGVG